MISAAWFLAISGFLASAPPVIIGAGREDGAAWVRHTIDGTSQGADGAKLGDFDSDGLLDIVTGWEEGGEVRVYRNPGPKEVRKPWPRVTVGRVGSPEDAIFVDFDGDGRLDVVSCCEGETKSVFLHRWNHETGSILKESSWRTEPIPALLRNQAWMQADRLEGRDGVAPKLILGSKDAGASVGLLTLPKPGERLESLNYRKLRDAGWIMSLFTHDMDGDGDRDIVLSDRKGDRTGAFWLENPGDGTSPWPEHPIGGLGRECVFADLGDLDGDGRADLAMAVKTHDIHLLFRKPASGWREQVLRLDPAGIGRAKAVKIADLDGDGLADLVFTCESATGDAEGVVWLRQHPAGSWTMRSLGGPAGTKFDLIQTLDLDGDGDLDVITCEEKENLGLIWYENPLRSTR